ncbi:MlaD family protein [Mycolicibacterium septicum]|uniref:MlaD family protein n=1 Tax=Mycolicibacterium septicum TaxID=98668 RepID=UPI00235E4FB9|nr:MlaD family protein [Mycolicibacterium septicum]
MAALWRFGTFGVLAVFLLILLTNIISQPVQESVRQYAAEFTDVSGLHPDADVRVRGVRVGKVDLVDIERNNGQSIAKVTFTLDNRYGVVSDTRLAIKYQALTGLRYVDVTNPSEKYSSNDLVTRVPTSMTQPSFDITSLFNGLQPVIATLSPDDINTFTQNAADYISGDGTGLASMLDSIRKLTEFVSDRQVVVSTLMRNLSDIASTMGGHSKDLIQLLDWINRPLDSALGAIDEFRKSQLYGPGFGAPLVRLLTNAGFPPDPAKAKHFLSQSPAERAAARAAGSDDMIDQALDRAFTNFDDFTEAIKMVPVMWDNIDVPSQAGAPVSCTRGRAQLPEQMDVLLNGQRVVLCNR